jgi:DNA-binding MurR/RpiR family transcriptional regulator
MTLQSDLTPAPAKTFLRQRIVRIQRIQDGLTMAEQRVLNYLWENGEKESSTTSRVLTVSQKAVSFAGRLSVVSVRAQSAVFRVKALY